MATDVEKNLTDDYVNDRKLHDKTLEQIKEEYNFDEVKDAFDEGKKTPGGDNDNFVQVCNFLSLNGDNNKFASFICSDIGQNIMTNNSLSIHLETGDIFYNNFKTKENF